MIAGRQGAATMLLVHSAEARYRRAFALRRSTAMQHEFLAKPDLLLQ